MTETESESSSEEYDWTGDILKDKYITLIEIGDGSYSTVWLAYEIEKKEYYAIKISKSEDYKTCLHETKVHNLIKKFNSENIMSLIDNFDVTIDEIKYHCEVMELMMCSLYNYVKNNGKLQLETALDIVRQIKSGLEVLHNCGIIHGDLKPENILVCGISKKVSEFIKKLKIEKITKNKNKKKLRDDIIIAIEKINFLENNEEEYTSEEYNENSLCSEDSESIMIDVDDSEDDNEKKNINCEIKKSEKVLLKVKISDLGSCVLPDVDFKRKKQIQTCYYMSPAILLRCEYDKMSDIWALGCLIYEIITGKILFNADNYDGNEERFHLYMITCCVGQISENLINKSRYKDVYFTADCKRIKGFKYYYKFDLFDNIKKNVLEQSKDENILEIYNIIKKCLIF